MATVEATFCVEQIGLTAGVVWETLDENGTMSLAQLAKQIDAPKDLVMQAVGWLAREEKVQIEEVGRKRVVSLI